MKCPKCAYISFDHHQVCPKCNKDISNEQKRLNLPAFKPDPPSLLGALTGEAMDSNAGIRVDGEVFASTEPEFTTEDSQVIEAMEETFKDTQSLEMQIEATPEPGIHFPEEPDSGNLPADMDGLMLEEEDAGPVDTALEEEDIVSLDLDDLSLEDGGEETEIVQDDLALDDLALDLEEPSAGENPDETGTHPDKTLLDTGEMVTSEIDMEKVKEPEGIEDLDLELDLDMDLDEMEIDEKP